jgi:hypothetical protein
MLFRLPLEIFLVLAITLLPPSGCSRVVSGSDEVVTRSFTNVRQQTVTVSVTLPKPAAVEKVYWIRPEDDVRNRFQEIIDQIKLEKSPAQIIFRGTFDLSGENAPFFHMEGMRDVTVDFRNSTFRLDGRCDFFSVVNCRRVSLKNARLIKYIGAAGIRGQVIRTRTGRQFIRIDREFRKTVREDERLQTVASVYLASPADTENPFDQYADFRFHPRSEEGGSYFSYDSLRSEFVPLDESILDNFDNNQSVIIKPVEYSANAFRVLGEQEKTSQDISISNVTVANVPGLFCYARKIRSGLMISGNRVIRDSFLPASLISLTGGALNLVAVNNVIVEDNDFGYHGDDSLNVHGNYLTVVSVNGSNELVAVGRYPNFPALTQNPRSKLEIFDSSLKSLGTAKATYQLSEDQTMVRIVLDREIGNLQQASLVSLLQWQPNLVYVANNFFHDHWGRGIVVQARNALVENNRIQNVSGAGIALYTEAGVSFDESGPCRDVTVRNNQVDHVGTSYLSLGPYASVPGAISIASATNVKTTRGFARSRLHRMISLTGNRITNAPGMGVFVNSAADVSIDSNVIDGYYTIDPQSYDPSERYRDFDFSNQPAIFVSPFTSRVTLGDNLIIK